MGTPLQLESRAWHADSLVFLRSLREIKEKASMEACMSLFGACLHYAVLSNALFCCRPNMNVSSKTWLYIRYISRRKCSAGPWAKAHVWDRAGHMHFLLNIAPGGRASGRLSPKTAKSQTWLISNMAYRLLIY